MLLGILMLILFIVSLAIPHWGYYEYDQDLNNQNLSSVDLIYQDTTNLDNDVPPDFKFPDDYSGDYSGDHPNNNPCSEEYSGSGECSKWSCSGSSDCSGDNSLLAKVTFSRRLPRARGFYHSESCKLDSNCV